MAYTVGYTHLMIPGTHLSSLTSPGQHPGVTLTLTGTCGQSCEGHRSASVRRPADIVLSRAPTMWGLGGGVKVVVSDGRTTFKRTGAYRAL